MDLTASRNTRHRIRPGLPGHTCRSAKLEELFPVSRPDRRAVFAFVADWTSCSLVNAPFLTELPEVSTGAIDANAKSPVRTVGRKPAPVSRTRGTGGTRSNGLRPACSASRVSWVEEAASLRRKARTEFLAKHRNLVRLSNDQSVPLRGHQNRGLRFPRCLGRRQREREVSFSSKNPA